MGEALGMVHMSGRGLLQECLTFDQMAAPVPEIMDIDMLEKTFQYLT
jgi:hypothetical protein